MWSTWTHSRPRWGHRRPMCHLRRPQGRQAPQPPLPTLRPALLAHHLTKPRSLQSQRDRRRHHLLPSQKASRRLTVRQRRLRRVQRPRPSLGVGEGARLSNRRAGSYGDEIEWSASGNNCEEKDVADRLAARPSHEEADASAATLRLTTNGDRKTWYSVASALNQLAGKSDKLTLRIAAAAHRSRCACHGWLRPQLHQPPGQRTADRGRRSGV